MQAYHNHHLNDPGGKGREGGVSQGVRLIRISGIQRDGLSSKLGARVWSKANFVCLGSNMSGIRAVPVVPIRHFLPKAQLVSYKVCRFTSRMLIRDKRLTEALRHTGLLFQVTMD